MSSVPESQTNLSKLSSLYIPCISHIMLWKGNSLKSASESQQSPPSCLELFHPSCKPAMMQLQIQSTVAKCRGSWASERSVSSGAAQHEHFHGQEKQDNSWAQHRNRAGKLCWTSSGFAKPKQILHSITLLLQGPLERVALLVSSSACCVLSQS